MDLHLVTYFVAVIDHGGITKAAQSLYISQPSLSQAIRTLERRLGVTLFDRTGRRLELTEDGARLETVARRILADVDRAKEKVAAVRELRAGRVDVVTYPAFGADPLVGMIKEFRTRFPRLTVRVVAADGPAGVLAALRRGEAEIGLADTDAAQSTLTTIRLGSQDLVLAGMQDRSTASRTHNEIRAMPLVTDLGDATLTELLEPVLADGHRNVVVDCGRPAATWSLVRRGIGATVTTRTNVRRHLPDAHVAAIEPPISRPYSLVLRSGRPSPAALAFIAAARHLHHTDGEPAAALPEDW